jgi:hypothetical protein
MVSSPSVNSTLHLCVIGGVLIQLSTVFLPGLSSLLGLELPDAPAFVWLIASVAASWSVAELYTRLTGAASDRTR